MLALTSRGRPRLARIEGLRAVAVLTVVATHIALLSGFTAANALGPLTARLNVGVALFFVLSAYLLYRPWAEARLNARPAPDVGRYAIRRLLRILPACWVALTVLGLLLPDEVPGAFGSDWWMYFGLLQVYSQDTVIGGLGVTWSLSTEFTFYLVLPLIAWATARLLGGLPREQQVRMELVLLVVSALLALAVRHVVSEQGWMPSFGGTLIGKWPWFAVGLGLAVARAAWGAVPMAERPRLARVTPASAWAWWAAALAVLLFSSYGGVLPRNAFALTLAESHLEVLAFALVGLFLVGPVVLGDPADRRGPVRVLVLAPVVWLGTISYGIFLWHYPVALWAAAELPDDAWPFAALTLAVTIPCAAASFYLVEQPLMKLSAGRRPSPATLAAGEAAP